MKRKICERCGTQFDVSGAADWLGGVGFKAFMGCIFAFFAVVAILTFGEGVHALFAGRLKDSAVSLLYVLGSAGGCWVALLDIRSDRRGKLGRRCPSCDQPSALDVESPLGMEVKAKWDSKGAAKE